jgi:hypothetical protein
MGLTVAGCNDVGQEGLSVDYQDSYEQVTSQRSLETFLERVDYFHDALIREVSILDRGYVDQDGAWHGHAGPADARVIVHSQWPGAPYVDIIFEGIQAALWNLDARIGLHDRWGPDGVELRIGERSDRDLEPRPGFLYFRARAMRYRILGRGALDERPSVVKRIPYGDLLSVRPVEGAWVQCPKCSDAWETGADDVVRCPGCGVLLWCGVGSVGRTENAGNSGG